jgi:hypothetical protein
MNCSICGNIQHRKQLGFPSARLHKIWSICMMNYHAALKKNEVCLVMLMELSVRYIKKKRYSTVCFHLINIKRSIHRGYLFRLFLERYTQHWQYCFVGSSDERIRDGE